MQKQTRYIDKTDLHKYVLGIVGVFILFIVTFSIACIRVSQDKKFASFHFHLKSLTLEGQLPNQSVVNKLSEQTFIAQSTKQTSEALGMVGAESVNLTSQTAEITEPEQLAVLNQKLYDKIAQNWPNRKFEQKLVYRVRVSPKGAIASYEPLNQPALDYVQQTPLPNLVEARRVVCADNSISAQAGSLTQQPLGKFEVVFTDQGILEVSPWQGWRKE